MTHRTGFTLIETMIAIALFSIMIAIGVGGFTVALRAQREAAALLGAQSNVSLAVEQMAREVRTGYLFCHDPINNPTQPLGVCGCNISASTYDDPSAPGAFQNGQNPGPVGYLPVWTCNAVQFYNANTDHVTYSLSSNGMLLRQEGGGAAQAITNSNVKVKYFNVILFGNTEGDNWTPRITIALGIAPSSSDPELKNNVLNLQTTISARLIDCSVPPPPAKPNC